MGSGRGTGVTRSFGAERWCGVCGLQQDVGAAGWSGWLQRMFGQRPVEAARVDGFGGGLGFTLVICIMGGIRENLEAADVPKALRGAGITLITAAIMTLAFMGLSGMIKG